MSVSYSDIAAQAAQYVAASGKIQQSNPSAVKNTVTKLVDKIGKQVTVDGSFVDRLPMLNGDNLPLGKTVEEWFLGFCPVSTYSDQTTEGAKDLTPAIPDFKDTVYSLSLGRQKAKTSLPYDVVERGCVSAEAAGNMVAKIVERLNTSVELFRYTAKKQLLGRAGDLAYGAGLVKKIAVPSNTATGEAFIKQIKNDVEDASFAHDNGGIAKTLILGAPELTLFIKKGYMGSLSVDTMAGAFNKEDLAIPAKIVVVDDFGTMTHSNVYAILVDPRGIKLMNGYNATRASENADGDFVNYVRHFEDTGFISKYCYIKAYSNEAE